MEKTNLIWELYNDSSDHEIRYCHNCGIKTIFTDTMKRRQNANGKDIYEFAIYKCSNEHTWNRKLNSSKPLQNEYDREIPQTKSEVDFINLKELESAGVKEVNIYLKEVEGLWRLDKVLAQQIESMSRNQIEKLINSKNVLVNDLQIKPGKRLKTGDTITIMLSLSN